MRYAIIKNGVVVNIAEVAPDVDEEGVPLTESSFAVAQGWIELPDDLHIGCLYENGEFLPAPMAPEVVKLDILSTDRWSIPADSNTYATVTYTSDTDVYFVVNDTIQAITPIDSIATLEITADAPGPIKVQVRYQQLIIAAEEVPL